MRCQSPLFPLINWGQNTNRCTRQHDLDEFKNVCNYFTGSVRQWVWGSAIAPQRQTHFCAIHSPKSANLSKKTFCLGLGGRLDFAHPIATPVLYLRVMDGLRGDGCLIGCGVAKANYSCSLSASIRQRTIGSVRESASLAVSSSSS